MIVGDCELNAGIGQCLLIVSFYGGWRDTGIG